MAIIAKTVAISDFGAIYNLGKFVLASYVAFVVMFGIHLIIITLSGLNPITYVKKAGRSIAVCLLVTIECRNIPLNIDTQTNRLGVPDGIANFAGSFGLSIGQNGCAGIYPAMLAVMIAPSVGQNPLEPTFLITLIVIVAISSFGVAGVGGGATFAAILVLSALNFQSHLLDFLFQSNR